MAKEDKTNKLPRIRIPLPKQRNQAFKDRTKYDRKVGKGSRLDPFSFC